MEAPEKIYVKRLEFESAHGLTIVSMEQRDDAVEYVRADTFREKVLEYIENNIYDHYDGDHEYGVCGGYVKKEEFIDGLIKYMKGE